MERNRWETAIRCLDIALHPNTSDDEVLAAVNGYRRTAAGTPLRDVCAAFTAKERPEADDGEWQSKLDRLTRDNRELRQRLKIANHNHRDAVGRLQDAEKQVRGLIGDLRDTQDRFHEIERQLTDLRAVRAERRFVASQQKFEPAKGTDAKSMPTPFHEILSAARQRMDHTDPASILRRAPTTTAVASRAPWTA